MHSASQALVARYTDGRHRHTKGPRHLPGYSVTNARVAHYRWNPRRVEIPHPVAYSNLVETLAKHWDSVISPRIDSAASQFTVRQHPDGRIASMAGSRPSLRPGVGSRFRVRTDIASFYDSIYTHAIPWAVMGKEAAKSSRGLDEPSNQIDSALRFARRGETTGISVGPGASLIIAELLLSRVDDVMADFRFERFLDDYVGYARTEVEAEEFVRQLDSALRQYGLQLSGRKTMIEALPLPDEPPWIRELRRANRDRPSELIDRAIDLSRADPQASAIRWVLSRLRQEVAGYSNRDSELVASRLAELAFTHPHTTPALVDVILMSDVSISPKDVDTLIQKHASDAQSSAVCWLLHLAWKQDQQISEASWEAVVASNDPLASAYLLQSHAAEHAQRKEALLGAVSGASADEYWLDEWWPARYVAFLDGRLTDERDGFDEMRQAGVLLLQDPRESKPAVDGEETPPDSSSASDIDWDDDWQTLGYSG